MTDRSSDDPESRPAGPEPPSDRPLWAERVLVVDGDEALRAVVADYLTEKGCEPRTAATAEEGLMLLNSSPFTVALVGVGLPRMDALDMLAEIKRISPDTEVVILAGEAFLETAVKASRLGAYDFLRKPVENLDEVWLTVRRAAEKRTLYLRNRKLIEDMEQRNLKLTAAVNRLTSLIDAGRAMSGILSISELLDFFIGQVVKELGADRASLMLLDENKEVLTIAASRGIGEDLVKKAHVRLGEGVSGWVAKTGKPILVKDVRTDPRARYQDEADMSESFISSPIVLSVPILFQEKVLGVINVTNRRSGGSFDDDDMAYLYGLAGQAAVAIERARKYEELHAAYRSLKAAQEQVVAVERLKALGQMAAGVAHDFNNILNAMMGRAELLLMELRKPRPDVDAVRHGVEVIDKICRQGAETVRRIQDISRIRRGGAAGTLDLNEVVRNTVEMTRSKWKEECEAAGRPVAVTLDLGEIPVIAGNAMEVSQALGNLVFNAVEAMPRGGEIRFRTRLDGSWVRLEVSDTGTGIPKDLRDRIFEPFFTTKESGQGLGMSVVYSIVARHGGEIAVESEENVGTCFRVSFPVKPPVGDAAAAEEKKAGPKPQARILVIEDDDLNREIVSEYVTLCGHNPSCARRGDEGLALFDSERFDLVVTDLSMPGMSGFEVAKKVKEVAPRVPVILLSGWAISQDESRVKESGVDYVLSKPCPLDKFRKIVETALGRGPVATS